MPGRGWQSGPVRHARRCILPEGRSLVARFCTGGACADGPVVQDYLTVNGMPHAHRQRETDGRTMRPICETACHTAVKRSADGSLANGARERPERQAGGRPPPILFQACSGGPMQNAIQPLSGIEQCCEVCIRCARMCMQELHQHCLTSGGRHAAAPHVQVMSDCSEICKTTANFLTRGSPRHGSVCRLCAAICDDCAESCATLDDMQMCVDACRACAASCRSLAA